MSGNREYDGPPLDGTVQWITERPELQENDEQLEGEEAVIYATEPEPPGEERSENVPIPTVRPEPIDEDGQTSLEDWSWRPTP